MAFTLTELYLVELVQRDYATVLVHRRLRLELCQCLRYLVRLNLTPSCLPLRYLIADGNHLHLLLRHGPLLVLRGALAHLLGFVQRRRFA